ncbi:hypothetical protein DZS_19780 [Dickeya ananatis]
MCHKTASGKMTITHFPANGVTQHKGWGGITHRADALALAQASYRQAIGIAYRNNQEPVALSALSSAPTSQSISCA